MVLRTIFVLLVSTFIGCSLSYRNIDFDQALVEADIVFTLYPTDASLISELPEGGTYLKSLDPKRVYITEHYMSLTLHSFFVVARGIVILRKGHELEQVGGIFYEKLSDRIFRWADDG